LKPTYSNTIHHPSTFTARGCRQKVTDELANEKSKHKDVRKALKKTRAQLAVAITNVEDITTASTKVEWTLEQSTSTCTTLKEELERTKAELKMSEETSKTRNTQLSVSQEAGTELQRLLDIATETSSKRETETNQEKAESTAAAELVRKEYSAAAETARTELAELTTTLRANEVEAAKALTKTNSKLLEATNQVQLGAQKLTQEQAALTAAKAQVQAERTRYESTMVALNCAQAEAAALAAIAASGALGLAHVSVQIKKLRARVDGSIASVKGLTVETKTTRTVQLEWEEGDSLGVELGSAEGRLGARVYALSGVAAKNELLTLGDVIVEINGAAALTMSIEEVVAALEAATSVNNTIKLVVAAADQIDMVASPFEEEKVAAAAAKAAKATAAAESAAAAAAGDTDTSTNSSSTPAANPAEVDGAGADGNAVPGLAPTVHVATTATSLPPPAMSDGEFSLVDAATNATEAKLAQAMNELQRANSVADALAAVLASAGNFTTMRVRLFRESQHKASRLEQLVVLMDQEKKVLDRELAEASATLDSKKATISQLNGDLEILTGNYTALGLRMGETETAKKASDIEKVAETKRADQECADKEVKEKTLGITKAELEKALEDLAAGAASLSESETALGMANTAIAEQDATLTNVTEQLEQMKSTSRIATENEYAMSQELTSVRCAFSDRHFHSRMPLDPRHVRLKRTACDQWHSSRKFTLLPVDTVNCVATLKASVRADSIEGTIATLTTDLQIAKTNVAELEAELRSTHSSEDKLLQLTADSQLEEKKVSADMMKLQAELAAERTEKSFLEAGLSEAIASLASSGSGDNSDQLLHAQKEILSLRERLQTTTAGNNTTDGGVGLTSSDPEEMVQLKAELETEKESASIAKDLLAKAGAERKQLEQDLQDLKLSAAGAAAKGSIADGSNDSILSSEDLKGMKEYKVQCGKLESDLTEAANKLAEKVSDFASQEQMLRKATSKIKELEDIIAKQAASRQSLEELLLEQSEESDSLRTEIAEGRSAAGEPATRTEEEFASLQRRAVECEQLLSLGMFERQSLQEALAEAQEGSSQFEFHTSHSV
jgi:chromosome segregation ATPase